MTRHTIFYFYWHEPNFVCIITLKMQPLRMFTFPFFILLVVLLIQKRFASGNIVSHYA